MCAIDTETNSLNIEDAILVGVSIALNEDSAYYIPINHKNFKDNKKVKDTVLAEFKSYDKDLRTLTYHVLLENFNTKYDKLNSKQKLILKEFINSADNGPVLKKFFNKEIVEIKSSLKEQTAKVTDKATKIKLEEIDKLIVEINKRTNVKSSHLVDLLQYHSLLEELNTAHG